MRLLRKPEFSLDVIVLCLALLALQQLTGAATIKAKAWLAPVLIQEAWQQTLASGQPGVRPWPWADTWPVAHLRVPALGIEMPVLAGDSGNALAFAPGHTMASAAIGSPGRAVIGGHRDTHFAFLQDLRPGDAMTVQLPNRETRIYEVQSARVVDSQREPMPGYQDAEVLLLVTCYPFNTLLVGGPLRYVVAAVPKEGAQLWQRHSAG